MDDDLKQHLEAMEERIALRIAGVVGTLTGVLEDRIAGVEAKIAGVEGKLEETVARLIERMRDMQTELLKAFGAWQENVQARVRQMEITAGNSEATILARMDTLERRLFEIERRLLMNPPAA